MTQLLNKLNPDGWCQMAAAWHPKPPHSHAHVSCACFVCMCRVSACPAGTYSAPGDVSCTGCSAGLESPSGAKRCCVPLRDCERQMTRTASAITRYNSATGECDNAENVPASLAQLCRPGDAARCLQPLTCSGASSCFTSAGSQPEVASTVVPDGVVFAPDAASPLVTVVGAAAYIASTTALPLRLVGSFLVPAYCPPPASFAVGTLAMPSGGCPVPVVGTQPQDVVWSADMPRPQESFRHPASLSPGRPTCVYLRVTGGFGVLPLTSLTQIHFLFKSANGLWLSLQRKSAGDSAPPPPNQPRGVLGGL
jgi:hypothetical protein